MTPELLHLQRSDTGLFVLTEPTTQTVVVGEELADAYARMSEALAGRPASAAPSTAGAGLFERRGTARTAVIAAALLLPVLWVGRIAFEVRAAGVVCSTPATTSQGHPTRVATTPSAFSDLEGTEDDEVDDGDDEAAEPERARPATAVIEGTEVGAAAPAPVAPAPVTPAP